MEPKQEIIEVLKFWIYKLDKNSCTPDEIKQMSDVAAKTLANDATIKEFADYFGVSESNVRATIARKVFAKPKRKVVYPFQALLKVAPSNWFKKK